MRSKTPVWLICLGAVLVSCTSATGADEVLHTYSDGSVDTVATATDSELRAAAITMEIIYANHGNYEGGDLVAEMDSFGDGRRWPQIELRAVEQTATAFCVEAGRDDYVRHLRNAGGGPQDGGC